MFKLNNKGQSLVMFVIIIPILLLIITLVYDVGNAIYEKNRLSNINSMTIEYGLDSINKIDENDLIDMILKNTNNLSNISVLIEDNKITIKLSKELKGTFGKVLNYSLIEVNSEYIGTINNNKKEIERIK